MRSIILLSWLLSAALSHTADFDHSHALFAKVLGRHVQDGLVHYDDWNIRYTDYDRALNDYPANR
jgi:hypothetical protein